MTSIVEVLIALLVALAPPPVEEACYVNVDPGYEHVELARVSCPDSTPNWWGGR